jgi:iron only hydrogenase large subunit-like protein/nitrogen-specific signal transduction histidine kinase
MPAHKTQLVFTLKDRCRVCYTCVRECPVKAIRIVNGQAEVIDKRCIGCGNCVKVCSQNAKVFLKAIDEVNELLSSDNKVIAIIAPSFPAEFSEINDYKVLVGMLKKLGFDYVSEVSFGADIVALKYEEILTQNREEGIISSDCPAIAFFIEQYQPELVPYLAPIVSPMVAMARIIRKKYGNNIKIVFIGPCIAKKAESDEVDEVITFRELREMFSQNNIDNSTIIPCDFDPPHSGKGAIFPISRGLLQTTNISENIYEGNVIVADGRVDFREAVKEFENGLIRSNNLELLCCEGCIMGPGTSPGGKRFTRRTMVGNYVKEKMKNLNTEQWKLDIEEYRNIDLSQTFVATDRRIATPTKDEIDKVLKSLGKTSEKDHLDCGTCGYETCEEHAIAIIEGLAENEMCLPFAIEKLHSYIKDLAVSNEKLATAQLALKQSEKLAHMGQLSAGIAHELNNPLGVITMYSNILKDETPYDNPIRQDLELIVEQTDRCKKIVAGLLNFARKNQVNYSEIDIVKLFERSIQSIIIPDNIQITLNHTIKNNLAMLDADQMIQVVTNLLKNGVEAMPKGGEITVSIEDIKDEFIINIKDNGTGIAPENMEKIFTPFFTTKGIGKGTGLGLPIIYGIIKMHKGQIIVTSNNDQSKGETGTNFKIILPRYKTEQ